MKEIKEDGSTDTSKEDEAAKKLHKFMFNIADGGTYFVTCFMPFEDTVGAEYLPD